jgi:hypothetical protein
VKRLRSNEWRDLGVLVVEFWCDVPEWEDAEDLWTEVKQDARLEKVRNPEPPPFGSEAFGGMDSCPAKGNKHNCLHGVVDCKRTLGNSKLRKSREGAKWHMVRLSAILPWGPQDSAWTKQNKYSRARRRPSC